MKEELTRLIQQALDSLVEQGQLPADIQPQVQIDRTRDKTHGDLASNIALTLAKAAKQAPRDLATLICAALPQADLVVRTEIAGPGFINFFLSDSSNQAVVRRILDEREAFGRNNSGGGQKVQVEFVSANPTGPLHVGHGRGAAVGDSLCRLLAATGWDVSSEFYYNDAGAQINNLALSVQARCQGWDRTTRPGRRTATAATTSLSWPRPTSAATKSMLRISTSPAVATLMMLRPYASLRWPTCAVNRILT